jgi:peptidoglycan/LPS O-acetylase OafA/YrhL
LIAQASGQKLAGRHSDRRDDIQGLRALAVLAVVVSHAETTWLPGGYVGVDVFFVISGFLITNLLIREWTRVGRISLAGFWARRARRILPASTLALLGTATATALFLPASQLNAVGQDIVWSALFAANWRFVEQGTDYFAQDRALSPMQHYWSLGVEEQFYFVWPLLVVAIGAFAAWMISKRLGASRERSFRVGVLGISGLIALVSFGYEWWLSGVNGPLAYFGTPARAWQLALGAGLAAALPVLRRIRPVPAGILGVAGIGAMLWSYVFLGSDGLGAGYPGWVALIPTLGGGAMLAAGSGSAGSIASRVISWRPLVWVGDISYSLYLWHFPILVIGTTYFAPAGWIVRITLIGASFLFAWMSYKFVENPIRHSAALASRHWLALAMGATLVVSSGTAGIAMPIINPRSSTIVRDGGQWIDLTSQVADPSAGWVSVPGCTAIAFTSSDFGSCDDYGDPNGAKQLIVLGDSRAANIAPPLSNLAKELGWKMTLWAKPACKLPSVTMYDESRKTPYIQCDEFHRRAFAAAIAKHPDLVVLTSVVPANTRVVVDEEILSPEESRAELVRGYRDTIKTFTDAGIRVAVVRAWPSSPTGLVDCLQWGRDAAECDFDRSDYVPPEVDAVTGLEGVTLVDISPAWCNADQCHAVVDGMLVYRDTAHLTHWFSESLAPILREEVFGALS